MARIRVLGELPSIKLNLSEYNIVKVFELVKLFQELDDEYGQQILQEEKKNILEFATRIGILCKRGNTYKVWSEYFAVLSDSYLYFYANPERISYESYVNITSFEFKLCSETEIGVPHAFKLTKKSPTAATKEEIHYFYCTDAASLDAWSNDFRKIFEIQK